MSVDNGFLNLLHVTDDLVELEQIRRQLLDLAATTHSDVSLTL